MRFHPWHQRGADRHRLYPLSVPRIASGNGLLPLADPRRRSARLSYRVSCIHRVQSVSKPLTKGKHFFLFREKKFVLPLENMAEKKDSTALRIERSTLKELTSLAALAPHISKTSLGDMVLREAIDWATGKTNEPPPLIGYLRKLSHPGQDFITLDEDRLRAIIREESSPAPPPTQPLKPIRYKPKHPRKPPEDPPSDTPPLR